MSDDSFQLAQLSGRPRSYTVTVKTRIPLKPADFPYVLDVDQGHHLLGGIRLQIHKVDRGPFDSCEHPIPS